MRQNDNEPRDGNVPQGALAAAQQGWNHNPGGGGDDLDMVIRVYSVAVLVNIFLVFGRGFSQSSKSSHRLC